MGAAPGAEPTNVVTGVADVVEPLEPDEGRGVGAAAAAVAAPGHGGEGTDDGLVEVDVDRRIEADETGGRATDGLLVDDALALGVEPTGDADVDRDPAGGETTDLGGVGVDPALEVTVVGGQGLVGRDAGLGLGLDCFEVGGHAREGDVDRLVPSGVAHLDGRDTTLDAVETGVVDRVRREAGLGLGLHQGGGDRGGLGEAGGLAGAAVDRGGGRGAGGTAGAGAAEVLELLDGHELAPVGLLPAVAQDHRAVDEDVLEDLDRGGQDLEAPAVHVDGAGGCVAGALGDLVLHEGRGRPDAAVLAREELVELVLGQAGDGVGGRGVAVVVHAVVGALRGLGVGGGHEVVAVDHRDPDVRRRERAVAVDVDRRDVESVPVVVAGGGVRGERGGGEGGDADEGEEGESGHGRAPDGRVFRTPSPGG